MKFFNFFKTGLGITILVLLVLAIIIIAFNWERIKAWWNSDADIATDTGTNESGRTTYIQQPVSQPSSQRSIIINNILSQYGNEPGLSQKLNQLTDEDLQIVLNRGANIRCANPCGGSPPFRGLCLSNCPD